MIVDEIIFTLSLMGMGYCFYYDYCIAKGSKKDGSLLWQLLLIQIFLLFSGLNSGAYTGMFPDPFLLMGHVLGSGMIIK